MPRKWVLGFIYVVLFFLSFCTWVYTMAISSDIPVAITRSEFLGAEVGILAILLIHIYLAFKGNPVVNLLVLWLPNALWIIIVPDWVRNQYHPYATCLSISMSACMVAIMILNAAVLIMRKVDTKRRNVGHISTVHFLPF